MIGFVLFASLLLVGILLLHWYEDDGHGHR